MADSITHYVKRAEECVRLANLTKDDVIQKELLTLRQSYLQTVERLVCLERGASFHNR